jgi:hypothetical protein
MVAGERLGSYLVLLLGIILALAVPPASAPASTEVYREPADFLSKAFDGETPEPRFLWIAGEIKTDIRHILGHDLGMLRLRYWQEGKRTAWILDQIGKTKPITTGVVVDNGRIEMLEVLIFRETRGFEVRYPFFTDQFRGAELTADSRLSHDIDGISGATLSVRALTKVGRLALLFHQWVTLGGNTR